MVNPTQNHLIRELITAPGLVALDTDTPRRSNIITGHDKRPTTKETL